MSPSYLLFQTCLPLFWTLTCMIWMELTRTDAAFSRIAMMLFFVQKIKVLRMTWNSKEHLRRNNKNPRQKWRPGGPHPSHEGGPPPRACPLPRGPPRCPPTPTPTLYICFQREKNQREEIIAFYDTEPPPSPKTSREGWSGVRSWLRRGESVAIVITNHPPSPISRCSPPCVSNSIAGLLDGDGLDEIYHVIKLVLLGFDP